MPYENMPYFEDFCFFIKNLTKISTVKCGKQICCTREIYCRFEPRKEKNNDVRRFSYRTMRFHLQAFFFMKTPEFFEYFPNISNAQKKSELFRLLARNQPYFR